MYWRGFSFNRVGVRFKVKGLIYLFTQVDFFMVKEKVMIQVKLAVQELWQAYRDIAIQPDQKKVSLTQNFHPSIPPSPLLIQQSHRPMHDSVNTLAVNGTHGDSRALLRPRPFHAARMLHLAVCDAIQIRLQFSEICLRLR